MKKRIFRLYIKRDKNAPISIFVRVSCVNPPNYRLGLRRKPLHFALNQIISIFEYFRKFIPFKV